MVSLDDVRAAAVRIVPYLTHTPTLSATSLGQLAGVRLWLKAELLARTGSFKVRGVFNTLLCMSDAERDRGLVSMSAGNHAAALAYGARTLGTTATIVMPETASPAKVAATKTYGGTVVQTDQPLLDVSRGIEEDEGRTLVPPFDDPRIIAGAGTIGLEILDAIPEVDVVVVPVGGGGLIAGIAVAVKARRPQTLVIGVEPTGADAMRRSLDTGHPVAIDRADTIADGLAAPFAGKHTYEIVKALVDDVVLVSDDEIVDALRLTYERTKLAVEPAGAAGVAALLSGRVRALPDSRVVVVASGGNIDAATLKRIL